MHRILITGAAGMAADGIRPLLSQKGYALTLMDIAEQQGMLGPDDRWISGSITDPEALDRAMSEVDLVVHLGGFSRENRWEEILHTNIDGTQKVLDAAVRAGVRRVLLASSTHAIGFWPAGTPAADLLPRPDTYYGVSKVAAEALGSVFADRYGMTIVSARIGTISTTPLDERHRRTWLSYADLVRLVEAVGTTGATGHHVVYAISANTLRWFPLEPGFEIGYRPQDDAEAWAPFGPSEEDPDDGVIGAGMASADYALGNAP